MSRRESFESWMTKVDKVVEGSIGLSAQDLPDMPYYDWYEEGMSPSKAAAKAKREAMEELGYNPAERNQRVVRNWWIEGEVDGVQTPIGVGPKARTGGFTLRINQRDEGRGFQALRVEGIAHEDGVLELHVIIGQEATAEPTDGGFRIVTER